LKFLVTNVGCAANPCQNNATCLTLQGDSGYVCQCNGSWAGLHCDI